MSNVKKAYQPLVKFLEDNADKKVKSILEEVIAMTSAKSGGGGGASNAIKDVDGNVVAIRDYYYKRYMPLVGEQAVEFGAKKNSATGFNTMCKEGVSNWTKQQRVAKQAGQDLLTRVASGEVAPTDIASEQAKIEAERTSIEATELGFETKEEVVAYLNDNGVTLPEETEAAA